ARVALHTLDQKVKALFLNQPQQIFARASGSSRLMLDPATINRWLADLGQAEAAAQLNSAGTPAHRVRVKQWMDQHLGSALPGLLVALNMWNVHNTFRQAQNDGRFTADELRSLGANAGYAANAIAALWLGPAWSRAAGMSASLGGNALNVAKAGYIEWLTAARNSAKDSMAFATKTEFANFSKNLIWRTAMWAALAVLATALEAWQLYKDIDTATSTGEQNLLTAKFITVTSMSVVGSLQLGGAVAGYITGYAWLMSNPVMITIALLGIAYLLISMAANRYKREELRLWLYRCNWGRGAVREWLDEKGHVCQMQSLLEILSRPSVVGKAIVYGGERMPRKWLGHWLQIQLPAMLEGQEVSILPTLVERASQNKEDSDHTKTRKLYDQYLNGNWVDPRKLGELPSIPGSRLHFEDFTYSASDQHRLWQVWIESSLDNPVIELAISYPSDALQMNYSQRYGFRLELDVYTRKADRANDLLNGELNDFKTIKSQCFQGIKISLPKKK
ncbi:hypothetical protein SJI00_08870, partial [Pseudomonas sp. RP23018S]|nr:hypothetical protein [Pseudomonas sp. RP23018S]